MSAGIRRAVFLNAKAAEDLLSLFLAFPPSFLKDQGWPQLVEGH